ncbi:MAG: GTP-binding protein [Oscillatoriales cyanobacterium RM2_1_1]|nr:GTP-binding protein [Oscillatoriales cyanobacterium SM2_3_0]NJO47988.1 GTP-binding protein [Oscillatoriales cyanobacterium RM2_1_1]
MITAVTGLTGVGKTHWIREQVAQSEQPVCYFKPDSAVPIDSLNLATEFPHAQVLHPGEEEQLLALAETDRQIYLELPWHLDLVSMEPLLQRLSCRRVAIAPTEVAGSEWQTWANEIVVGNAAAGETLVQLHRQPDNLQIHQGLLTGEIIDWASLSVFWFELIQGAYGKVIRAKGIFDIVSGESIYGDFVYGTVNPEFLALDLPRWLEGRPERLSGFEIVGCNLDKTGISQTLKQCCVPESHIEYYQQQVKQSLAMEEVSG